MRNKKPQETIRNRKKPQETTRNHKEPQGTAQNITKVSIKLVGATQQGVNEDVPEMARTYKFGQASWALPNKACVSQDNLEMARTHDASIGTRRA